MQKWDWLEKKNSKLISLQLGWGYSTVKVVYVCTREGYTLAFTITKCPMALTPTAVDAIHQAAKDGNTTVLKKASKKELNRPGEDGWTAVHWAAWSGHPEALRIILEKG